MRFVTAVLLFPVRPADVSPRLTSLLGGLVVALLPALFVGLAARLAGAAMEDVGALAAATAAVTVGLGLGGALGCRFAGAVVGADGPLRGRLVPCLVFGAWTVTLFLLILFGARLSGQFALAGLIAGLAVLVWGAVVGIGVVDPHGEFEYGRALVGSCVGITGAILGLYLAVMPVKNHLAFVVPAPPDAARGWEAGDFFVVRQATEGRPGDVVLLHDARTGEGLVAVVGAEGGPQPIGPREAYERGAWAVAGRAFLRIGRSGAAPVPSR